MQAAPAGVGLALANWHWAAGRQFVEARGGLRLCRRACTRCPHRRGFVCQRPKKRLLTADEARRTAFAAAYAALLAEARAGAAQSRFADEAHVRAAGDSRGAWARKGQAARVDASGPRWGAQAGDYAAACPETGEGAHRALPGTRASVTSAAFLRQVRASPIGPLVVIWDTGPAHGGDAVRDASAPPGLALRPVRLPAYRPDCTPAEASWARAREAVTANTCLGTEAQVPEGPGRFFAGLADRTAAVQARCRRTLQTRITRSGKGSIPNPVANTMSCA